MSESLEVLFRSLIAIFLVWIMAKLFVRKAWTQFTLFEAMSAFVITTIAAIGSLFLTIPFVYLILSIVTWGFVLFIASWLALKSKRFRNLYYGKGIPLIQNGKILEEAMKKQRYTTEQLLSQLRQKAVFQAADVEFAILEPAGELSVLLKRKHQPLVAKDVGIDEAKIKEPQAVIIDGKVLDEPLARNGLNRRWLETELSKLGVALENVFLAQVDQHGQLHVDLFDDQLEVGEPSEAKMFIATLKKAQADLETFALETSCPEAKEMYVTEAKKLEQLLQKLTPHFKM